MPDPVSRARAPFPRHLVLPLMLALTSLPVAAHKLQVFAFAEGDRIEGTAYFAGGAKAAGARIQIRDAAGQVLAQLTPTDDGHFRYRARTPTDHFIVAESGDGHRAQWRVRADELAGGFPRAGADSPQLLTTDTPTSEPTETERARLANPVAAPVSGETRHLDPTLIAAIDQAVARQVRPLREQLIAAQDEVRLRDILGGLGYILGLTGLALWWHGRRPDPRA